MYNVQKSLNVCAIGDHYILQAELEAGADLGYCVPFHGVPVGCLESLLGVVGPAVHFPL